MARLGDPIRLAVVDRDSGFTYVLGKRVEARGWEQRVLTRPPSVEQLVALRLVALVIDIALLGADAWDYLQGVRTALPSLPLVVCTSGAGVAQRVQGLRLGADDWLAKPCHPEELIARIEAIVRRMRVAAAGEEALPGIDTGELLIRRDRFQAYVGETSLNLTRREFEMLCLLAAHAGCVLEREAIYQHVWGYAMARGDRSVDVFVRKLRCKLERGSREWRYIHTHFGVGYRFEARRAEEADRFDTSESAVTPRAPRATPHLTH